MLDKILVFKSARADAMLQDQLFATTWNTADQTFKITVDFGLEHANHFKLDHLILPFISEARLMDLHMFRITKLKEPQTSTTQLTEETQRLIT